MKRKSIDWATKYDVLHKYNCRCSYCGCGLTEKEMQVDHLQPFSKGGACSFENYMPACRKCNMYKKNQTLEEYREDIKGFRKRLESNFMYRLSKKYGIIKELENEVVFYFERIKR